LAGFVAHLGHKVVVPVLEIVNGNIWVSWNDIAAVIEDVTGMTEEGSVTWKKSLVVKDDTISIKVVGSSVNVSAGANASWGFGDKAKVGGKPRRSTISTNQNTGLKGLTTLGEHSPEPFFFRELGILKKKKKKKKEEENSRRSMRGRGGVDRFGYQGLTSTETSSRSSAPAPFAAMAISSSKMILLQAMAAGTAPKI
jgi:hypothetical protein